MSTLLSEEFITLRREIHKHPALVHQLIEDGIKHSDYGEVLGATAAYLNIAVDGVYSPQELDKMADVCYWKLRQLRTGIITH